MNEMGVEETLKVCASNNQISPLTLRTNTLRTNREDLIRKLKENGLNPFPTLFGEDGICLESPPPTSELPFMKEGFFLIQDEASQLVTSILDPRPGERVLDACAAPGTKTTHIAGRMKNEGEIVAIDLSYEKLSRVAENCQRLGVRIVKPKRGDATQALPFPKGVEFDRVLADVPCSGFGTLQKNPDLKWKRGEEDVRRLSALQFSILKNLSGYVKTGGILVYSTCTVFPEENEEIIERFLMAHPEFQLESPDQVLPRIDSSLLSNGCFKSFPPRDGMDGFFAARLVRE